MYGWYYDPTFILVFAGLILTLIASAGVKSTFAKYSRVRCMAGYTGAQAAQEVLRISGIYDVRIERVAGELTDHYDPRSKVLRLSDSTYGSNSVAAVCVAAHECGHAMQDAGDYAPLRIRAALVPVANFGAQLSWPLIIIGILLGGGSLVSLGILLFSLAVLFQIVTLPVEYNASSRAVKLLDSTGILVGQEVGQTRSVLNAAALTYVAAAAAN